ncbi:UvrD-helicase domain-containing protein [Bifidobacterium samirii]|uniref:DNA 3'-5' helicase n=1 Tax=Bifidobacterium samirii TaxID=2306974 RepID=A0A430FPE3_9BIFI|nr:UvrD-helicase domain-containing protein [Bifidobacterium samirii]RSX54674.1 UvrD/REP helicase N-terminal domain-containing protein [Bifidobacterium samirii]
MNDNRYFISASAGTGKTTRLLQDVMADLLERARGDAHASIRESLIVTFTIAAAAELRAKLARNIDFAVDYARSYMDGGEPLHDDRYLIGGDDGDLARMIVRDPRLAEAVFAKAADELPSTQISTIDALDKHIVDRNADTLGIDPGYRIMADEAIRAGMQHEVLDAMFERWYDPSDPEHDAFLDLLDSTGGAEHDGMLAGEILRLYDLAQTKPNGLAWLDDLSEPYRVRFDGRSPLLGVSWTLDGVMDGLCRQIEETRQRTADTLAGLGEKHRDPRDGMTLLLSSRAFAPVFAAIDDVTDAYRTGSWDDAFQALDAVDAALDAIRVKPGTKPEDRQLYKFDARYFAIVDDLFPDIVKGTDGNKTAMEALQGIVKGPVADLHDVFAQPAARMDAIDALLERRIDTLVRLTGLFEQEYREAKRRAAVQEFSDIAHLALKALERDDVRRRVTAQWRYVYVDECQDNNALQNRFIDLVGRDAAKVTMVGDVKQSIYGFRYAQPEEFRRRSREVSDEHRSTLVRNHRSVPEILVFVNTVFDHLMRKDMGGADYRQDRFRIPAAPERFDATAVELLVRDTGAGKDGNKGDGESDGGAAPSAGAGTTALPRITPDQQQADMIVRRIRALHDEEGYRYGDIAVLERSTKLFGDLHAALVEAGIDVEVNGVGDFYAKPEIMVALDWLRAIDNPHRDVPLVALMRAHGIPDNVLAAMRLLGDGGYYGLLYRIARPSERFPLPSPLPAALAGHIGTLRALLDQLESLRSFAATHPVDALLWRIYTQTGWYDYCGGLPDGRRRQANLAQLCVKARAASDTGDRGIPAFLRAVDRWQANDDKDVRAEATTLATGDAVHLTTIHKAKGLQWKVVILADATSASFNEGNLPRFVTVPRPGDPDHGVAACRLASDHAGSAMDTFQRRHLASLAKRQSVDEQLRLLYVALTRPERRLIVAGTCQKGFDAVLEGTHVERVRDDGAMSTRDILDAPTYMNWILKALLTAAHHGDTQDLQGVKSADGLIAIPDGLAEDTDAGDIPGRVIRRWDDAGPAVMRILPGDDALADGLVMQRPSPDGFLSVDERVPDASRRPLTLNASGIRSWAQAVGAGDSDDPDAAADAIADDDAAGASDAVAPGVRPDADERSWRFAAYPLPSFLTGHGAGPSAAEIGTSVHNVLEQFDWSTPTDARLCAAQLLTVLHRLADSRIIAEPVARRIEEGPLFDAMMWFVCAGGDGSAAPAADGGVRTLADGIRAHRGRLFREAPFSLLLDDDGLRAIASGGASRPAHTGDDGDGIVVRGVIDGYYVDDATRTIVLFDYKTDAMRDDERDDPASWCRRLRDDYIGQQALYAEALERLYPGYTVTQRWLVGLAGRRLIDVTPH